jgi:hypothetical protein
VVINEIIRDANSPDQKLLTSKRSLHLAVSINIAALITNANTPSDNRIAGSVSSFTTEPIKVLINPKSSATHK